MPKSSVSLSVGRVRSVAELDYAFLAEYARVDPSGSLTSVGASYTHVGIPMTPTQHLLSVAGRIRITTESPSVLLRVVMRDAAKTMSVSYETTLEPVPGARVYAGNKLGILFALNTLMPIIELGSYEVVLELDDVEVRRLYFTAETVEPAEL